MIKRLITTSFRSCLTYAPLQRFSIMQDKLLKETDNVDQPILDLYAKRMRKIVLDRTILQKDKLIIPTIRLREEDDTLEKLRNSKLCAGTMIPSRRKFIRE